MTIIDTHESLTVAEPWTHYRDDGPLQQVYKHPSGLFLVGSRGLCDGKPFCRVNAIRQDRFPTAREGAFALRACGVVGDVKAAKYQQAIINHILTMDLAAEGPPRSDVVLEGTIESLLRRSLLSEFDVLRFVPNGWKLVTRGEHSQFQSWKHKLNAVVSAEPDAEGAVEVTISVSRRDSKKPSDEHANLVAKDFLSRYRPRLRRPVEIARHPRETSYAPPLVYLHATISLETPAQQS